jgi:hypothetical protein
MDRGDVNARNLRCTRHVQHAVRDLNSERMEIQRMEIQRTCDRVLATSSVSPPSVSEAGGVSSGVPPSTNRETHERKHMNKTHERKRMKQDEFGIVYNRACV